MRSASSSESRVSSRRRLGALVVGALALTLLAGGAPDAGRTSAPALASYRGHHALAPAARKLLRTSAWAGGTFTASTGESVRVLVSDSYPDPQAVGQRWADYLASLLHGSELGRVNAYVLHPGRDVVSLWPVRARVLRRERARVHRRHRLRRNARRGRSTRVRPPRGPRTVRIRRGSPQPGGRSAGRRPRTSAHAPSREPHSPGSRMHHYELNPGEGYAEVYRVLNELKKGVDELLVDTRRLVVLPRRRRAAGRRAGRPHALDGARRPNLPRALRGNRQENLEGGARDTIRRQSRHDSHIPAGIAPRSLTTRAGTDASSGAGSGPGWRRRSSRPPCAVSAASSSGTTRAGAPGRFSLRVTHD